MDIGKSDVVMGELIYRVFFYIESKILSNRHMRETFGLLKVVWDIQAILFLAYLAPGIDHDLGRKHLISVIW